MNFGYDFVKNFRQTCLPAGRYACICLKFLTSSRSKLIKNSSKDYQATSLSAPHNELHRAPNLSDVILGGQDGLVNVLGLVLGVAASSGERHIILAAGFAAALAESVSMAAVAYTSLVAKADHYQSELARERREVIEFPDIEKEETREIYRRFGFDEKITEHFVDVMSQNKEQWVQFMMAEELHLEPIARETILKSAATVGIATVVGSLIPIVPFFFSIAVGWGIIYAVIISGCSLFAVGVYKARVSVGVWYKSGIQMLIIGLVAAFLGYGVGLLFRV